MSDSLSEYSEWDDDEWERQTRPLYEAAFSNGQSEFFDTCDIAEVVEQDALLSSLYISYCNHKNLKQKTKIFKVRDEIKPSFIKANNSIKTSLLNNSLSSGQYIIYCICYSFVKL